MSGLAAGLSLGRVPIRLYVRVEEVSSDGLCFGVYEWETSKKIGWETNTQNCRDKKVPFSGEGFLWTLPMGRKAYIVLPTLLFVGGDHPNVKLHSASLSDPYPHLRSPPKREHSHFSQYRSQLLAGGSQL